MARILIVDDQLLSRQSLAAILGVGNHQILEAVDGEEAMILAQVHRPDLVIADVFLSSLNDYALIRSLRALPHMSYARLVLMAPGYFDVESQQLAQACGATHVLPKPSDPVVIERIVAEALAHTDTTVRPLTPEFEREHRQALTKKLLRRVNELEGVHFEMRKALHQAEQTQKQQIQQQRLEALSQMAGGLAHDFNNALGPILGFSELLLRSPEKLKERETLTSLVKMINTSAKDAAQVVRELREFYRHREQDEVFLPVSIDKLLEQVVVMTDARVQNRAQERGIQIEVRAEVGRTLPVYGIESELREAAANLVFSATDAMRANGRITLRTKLTESSVILEVSDTGPAMSEEACRHCFEPFYRSGTDRTGLGLAMVYGIVERHEGSITVDSKPGRETIFRVRLPLRPHQQMEPTVVEMPGTKRPLHVLLVDDETMVSNILSLYLTGDGHTVEQASDGTRALEKFKQANFDLVITDRAMPGMNGEQLAALIKQQKPRQPVILLTGFGATEPGGSRPPGVDCVLGKPVTIAQMRKAIGEVVAA